MTLGLLLVLATTRGAVAQHPLQVPPERPHDLMTWLADSVREAAATLQGNQLPGADSAVVLDSALVMELARAMQEIHRKLPALHEALSDATPYVVELGLTPDSGRAVRNRSRIVPGDHFATLWDLPVVNGLHVTGIAALDSVGAPLGGSAIAMTSLGDDDAKHDPLYTVILQFLIYVNVPVLIERYRRVAGVAWPHAADGLPYYTHTSVHAETRADRAWIVEFDQGGGDCPAGCTFVVKTIVRYDRQTRDVRLVAVDTIGRP